MKKLITTFFVLFISIATCFADSYTVKYKIVSKGSTTHSTATLELKNGTESEAKAELVRKGTVSKENAKKLLLSRLRKRSNFSI